MLNNAKLPYEDCKFHLDNFFVMEDKGKIISVGGTELYGDIALLRSIAVPDAHRGKGVGNATFLKIREHLEESGIKTVYLLTETAEEYFGAHGFKVINRDLTPPEIQNSQQFSSLCLSSAAVMKATI